MSDALDTATVFDYGLGSQSLESRLHVDGHDGGLLGYVTYALADDNRSSRGGVTPPGPPLRVAA